MNQQDQALERNEALEQTFNAASDQTGTEDQTGTNPPELQGKWQGEYNGVYFAKWGYRAAISVDGDWQHLGYFKRPEMAAYVANLHYMVQNRPQEINRGVSPDILDLAKWRTSVEHREIEAIARVKLEEIQELIKEDMLVI